MIKQVLYLFLAILLILCAVACAPSTPSDEPIQPDAPIEPEQPIEEEEIVPACDFLDLIIDGQSDYVLVYEDDLGDYATLLTDLLEQYYGVTLSAVAATDAEADYGYEIVLGNARKSASRVAKRLNETNDFAMCIDGDDWVLVATERALYTYLLAVIDQKTLSSEGGDLSIELAKDFVYHDSLYKYKDYLQFISGGKFSQEVLSKLFDARTFVSDDGTELAYRLYVPYDYAPDKDYPVLLLLHGAGERGNDNKGNILYMFSEMFGLTDTPVSDAIIIAPQCPTGNQWVDTPWAKGSYSTEKVAISNELCAVMELLGEISMEYSTDPDRYYVMGLSMGGFGTWDLLMRYPDVFAAGVPICGGADPSMADTLVDMPIWTFHGDADTVVPVSGTREMAAALEAAGSTVFKYTELAGSDHGIWSGVAKNKSVLDWLFAQSK